jgi:hypothetical protein
MSGGYAKIFETILVSTVWQLSKEARVLWITMLVLKDRDQVVHASLPGLAHAARLTVDETKSALKELEKPDPYSQSKTEGGARIKTLEGSRWWVVNGEKYQRMLSKENKRANQAAWIAEKRERRGSGVRRERPGDGFKRVGGVPTYSERLQTECVHDGEWVAGTLLGMERCVACGLEREKVNPEEREIEPV